MTTLFSFPIRIYYEDTDAGGVVYYANYLKFAERARTEWLRHLGFDQTAIRAETRCLIVVKRVEADYKAPAFLDDALCVECALQSLDKVRMTMHQRVLRGTQLLVDIRVELVCVNSAIRPTPWPTAMAAAFATVA
jgi:acyl-CoA thioester hydrolase